MTPANHYQHILWDWNGTLLDDVDLCAGLLNRMLERHGLERIDREAYRRTLGFPIIEYYRALGFDFERTPFEELSRDFMAMYRRRWRECGLQPGAAAALAAISYSGIPQSILSATEIGLLREGVAHFGIEETFVRLAALDNPYADGKIEIGRMLLQDLRQNPGRVLLIGDTQHDRDVAAALGMDCWLVTCGHHSEAMLSGTGAPLLDSLKEVPARLAIGNPGRE